MRKGQKGKLDAKGSQRWQVRLGKGQIRQRRAATDPAENFGGLFAGVLAGRKAAKLRQGMFGQTLDKFLARIPAGSKNRDFRFLHDVVALPSIGREPLV